MQFLTEATPQWQGRFERPKRFGTVSSVLPVYNTDPKKALPN